MGFACITAGFIGLIMSTYIRGLTQVGGIESIHQFKRLFGIPSLADRELILGMIGQLMSILWIVIGITLVKASTWFSFSPIRVYFGIGIAFSPIIVGVLVIKVLGFFASKN